MLQLVWICAKSYDNKILFYTSISVCIRSRDYFVRNMNIQIHGFERYICIYIYTHIYILSKRRYNLIINKFVHYSKTKSIINQHFYSVTSQSHQNTLYKLNRFLKSNEN